MSALTVGGVVIPVAARAGSRSRLDNVDRGRRFDNSYSASQTGGAAREWHFTTPPVTRVLADTYEAQLAIVSAQMCSGDIIGAPTMCCAEIDDPWTPIKQTATSHLVELSFTLHEVQPANVLLRYAPGNTITGESFSRSTVGRYRNGAGIPVASAAIDVKRDAHIDIYDAASTAGLLLEDTRTNIAVSPRDLTNAAWTKTNMTAALNQIGVDGAANSATALTATAGNATCTQVVTLASSARSMSAFVFRGVGSGVVEMTTDGGATWTPITLGGVGVYVRVSIPPQTLANPNFGFRIITSGDAIGVDYVSNENGSFPSSPISSATTRGADSYSLPYAIPPGEFSAYVKFIELGSLLALGRVFTIASAADATPKFALGSTGSFYQVAHITSAATVTSVLAAAPAIGNTVELLVRAFADGSVDIMQSINGGAATSGAQSAANAFASAWSGSLVWLNSAGTAGGVGFADFKSFKIVAGIRSLAHMRTA